MMNTSASTDSPFWMDEADPYLQPRPAGKGQTKSLAALLAWSGIVWRFGLALFLVSLAFRSPWLWVPIIYLGAIALLRYLAMRKQNHLTRRVAEIQQFAREKTGASTIGSAIHTAGHPLLQINQPVVLALKGDHLSIYSYQHAAPLDTLLLKDIQSVDLVTHDDEGIPHTGVLDQTAQALQVHFQRSGQVYTCLFRRMYKVRAVGWYQAIQAARLAAQS